MEKYLCDLPSEWRIQIAKVICKYINPPTPLNCGDVKKCETLTSLSSFTVMGSTVCIDYTDENGTLWHRCFDMAKVGLDLDPKCIMDKAVWDTLTWEQQIQAIIDYACQCHPNYCRSYTLTNTETEDGIVSYQFTYTDCNGNTHTLPLPKGESITFCRNAQTALTTNFSHSLIDNGVCGECIQYTIVATDDIGTFNYTYLDCAGNPVSGSLAADEKVCVWAITGSIIHDPFITLELGWSCSTTTTTTLP